MKKSLLLMILNFFSVFATAQETEIGLGNVSFRVVPKVTVNEKSGQSLQFGNVLQGATAQAATQKGTFIFDFGGEQVTSFSVDVSNVNFTVSAGDPSAIVFALAADGDFSTGHTLTSEEIDSGSIEFTIDGSLEVPNNQAEGDYFGNYNITVTYQ